MSLLQQYNQGAEWSAPVKPEITGVLSLVFIVLSIFLLSSLFMADKTGLTGSIRYVAIGSFVSLTIGFASIFLANYVGVYS